MSVLTKEILYKTIDNFENLNILVIGDIILDEYVWGKASRLSPEAPVPVLEVKHRTYVAGGASNVANNITSLGAKAMLCGVLGDDAYYDVLQDIFQKNTINSELIVKDVIRPTTVKTRLIAHNNQQLARIDNEVKTPISNNLIDTIIKKIQAVIDKVDLIICSDYSKGVLQDNLIQRLVEISKDKKIYILADPKGLDFTKYKGVNYITPNLNEAYGATKSDYNRNIKEVANDLKNITEADNIIITLSEDGVYSYDGKAELKIPAVSSEVYDVTGAGDTFLATFALSLIASKDIKIALTLANFAAGVAVRKVGTTAVKVSQLKNIINSQFDEYISGEING